MPARERRAFLEGTVRRRFEQLLEVSLTPIATRREASATLGVSG